MKNYLEIIIVTGCFVWLALFFTKLVINEQELGAQLDDLQQDFDIELQSTQSLLTEQLQEIGTLQPHIVFSVSGEQADYYEVRFGATTVLVEKNEQVIKKQAAKRNKEQPLANMIKVINKATVFEQPTADSQKIAELHAGFRYPVIAEQPQWYVVELGGRKGYIAKQNTQEDIGIPVLVYHHLLPKEQMTTTASTVSEQSFSEQMRYLHSAGFTTITTEQLTYYLHGEIILPINSVLITFDDGLLSTKEYAYPILKAYQFTAVQHMISSRIQEQQARVFDSTGPLQFFSEQDMTELADVFHYEAHTHDLHRLQNGQGVALTVTAQQIEQDLVQNMETLGSTLSIAYPFGHYNELFIEAAKKAGLVLGFTTSPGYASVKTSPYEIGRLGMTEKTTFAQFTSYVKGEFVQH